MTHDAAGLAEQPLKTSKFRLEGQRGGGQSNRTRNSSRSRRHHCAAVPQPTDVDAEHDAQINQRRPGQRRKRPDQLADSSPILSWTTAIRLGRPMPAAKQLNMAVTIYLTQSIAGWLCLRRPSLSATGKTSRSYPAAIALRHGLHELIDASSPSLIAQPRRRSIAVLISRSR